MNERLTKALESAKETVLSLIPDKEAGQKAIEALLLAKGELDVKEVEVDIPVDSVVKRYPITEAMEIVRCKTAIFFHSTGFWLISKPTLANNFKGGALFEMLESYCDYMDIRDTMEDEEMKERYDIIYSMMINVLTVPLDIFTDGDYMLDISKYILEKRNEYFTSIVEASKTPTEESVSDSLENAAFEAEVAFSEAMKKKVS